MIAISYRQSGHFCHFLVLSQKADIHLSNTYIDPRTNEEARVFTWCSWYCCAIHGFCHWLPSQI